MPCEDYEESVALDDDGAVNFLEPFFDLRPDRRSWRDDPDQAPLSKPVFAREPDSIRVLIAIRDEEGWACIRRDGELCPLEAVASWAPLAAALR